MSRKLTDEVQLKLRFSEKLRRRLEGEAKRNKRSMNAEIIDRLEQSFTMPDLAKATATAVIQMMNEPGRRIAASADVKSVEEDESK
jgi:hypothetical protein